MNNREKETLSNLVSFAFVMSENMVGLSKGNYDEKRFIDKTYDYLQKYVGNFECREVVKALMSTDKSKGQENKKYLKWEDLDFKEVSQLDHKIIKAKLNEQLYELDLYRYGGYKRVEIRVIGNSYNYNLGEGYVVCIDEEFPETIQFFNDLHLERVE